MSGIIKTIKVIGLAFIISIISFCTAFADTTNHFSGSGTNEDPFLIQSREDLIFLRDSVNTGNAYKGVYFRLTQDIDLSDLNWIPIGTYGSGSYFKGVFDGNGHSISSLTIRSEYHDERDNVGLFGVLGGTVANLSVTNADVSGACCGIISSHSAYEKGSDFPTIINCYTEGTLRGSRCSGIADHFDGRIINCISDVKFPEEGSYHFGILSYPSACMVYHCKTTAENIANNKYKYCALETIDAERLADKQAITNWNTGTAFSQILFGNRSSLTLLQIDPVQTGTTGFITFSDQRNTIRFVEAVNEWFFPVLLLIVTLLVVFLISKNGKTAFWEKHQKFIIAAAVISFIIAFFVDCAALGCEKDYVSAGSAVFIILINLWVIAAAVPLIKNHTISIEPLKTAGWPLAVVMGLTLILELVQFRLTPRYDAHLYYGSFLQSLDSFNLDLLTFLGAFVNWGKWVQGSALLIAPFEFLLKGKVIGIYIANVFITEITLFVLYQLIKESFEHISDTVAAVASFILIVCPYQLGLFTYLCYDNYLTYYAVWLLYVYKKDNDWLISFAGFLMTFTKVTGLVFYALFLIAATGAKVWETSFRQTCRNIGKWFKLSKVLLWVLPAVLFLFTYRFGNLFVINYCDGLAISNLFAPKSALDIITLLLQTFVFGFRWLFSAVFIAAILLFSKIYKNRQDERFPWLKEVSAGIICGCLGIFILLLVFNGDDCPRYTAIFNILFVFFFIVFIDVLNCTAGIKAGISIALAFVLLIQSFFTIDPAILLHRNGIYTGTTELRRLDFLHDKYNDYDSYFGDLYTYNTQSNYYNDLIVLFLKDIDVTKQSRFYVLDVMSYELHLDGIQYPIYWNTRLKRMTYDGNDQNSILLTAREIHSGSADSYTKEKLGNDFYLIVPARVNENIMIDNLIRNGYTVPVKYLCNSLYGAMRIYHVTL